MIEVGIGQQMESVTVDGAYRALMNRQRAFCRERAATCSCDL